MLNRSCVGQALTPYAVDVERGRLRSFAKATGQTDRIYFEVDIDFARNAGMPGVFVHGMLSMAFLGRMLTNAVSQHRLREINERFPSIVHLGARLTCTGVVVEEWRIPNGWRARLALRVHSDAGDVTIVGAATVDVPVNPESITSVHPQRCESSVAIS